MMAIKTFGVKSIVLSFPLLALAARNPEGLAQIPALGGMLDPPMDEQD
jgi:hypothetical protein